MARQPIVAVALRSDDKAVRFLTDPAALAVIRIGSGVVVIDQVNWHGNFTSAELRRRASQYLTQLLTNLGGAGTATLQTIAADALQADKDTLALWHFEDENHLPRILDYGHRGLDMHARDGMKIVGGRSRHGVYFPGGRAHANNPNYVLQTEELTYLVRLKDGRLLCVDRLDSGTPYGHSFSHDDGKT
ncbi:MAG: hypothetical protein RMI91_11520 [Gemmatales bacterium]|nr:hypothetical protein [Gemmatales bacterium]MDW7995273.1 hypothetical protein [Gemmatales bacterium]